MAAKLAAILAGSLIAAPAALANEGSADVARYVPSQPAPWKALPLPPVPYLETIPWFAAGTNRRGQKIDFLLDPRGENLKFAVTYTPTKTVERFLSGRSDLNRIANE